MTPRKQSPARGMRATDSINAPPGKLQCVQIYSSGKDLPLSPSQYPCARSKEYTSPLICTVPRTMCFMLQMLCLHSRNGTRANGPMISYFKGKREPKSSHPFALSPCADIASRIPLSPNLFFPMEIVFPFRQNACAGNVTAHDCFSVIICMEQVLSLPVR